MTELKPCPFCGNDAVLYEEYEGGWVIECKVCFVKIWRKNSKKAAIKAWNRRANNDHTD